MTKSQSSYNPRAVLAGVDRELLYLAIESNFEIIGVADPNRSGKWLDYELVPSDEFAIETIFPDVVINGIDQANIRERIDKLYSSRGIAPATLIGGEIDSSTKFGPGLILQRKAIISCDCVVDRCVKVNINATVMHDARIGAYTTIAPGAVLLGRVRIGKKVFIGANATVLPEVKIGDGSIVGAGAVVTRDVTAGTVVAGVPARAMSSC